MAHARGFIQIGANAEAFFAIQAASALGANPEVIAALTDVVLAQRGDLLAADNLLKNHLSQLQPREAFEAVARCHVLHLNWHEIGMVLDQWTATIPDDPAVSYYRGQVAEASDKFEEAILHYSKAEQLNSRYHKPIFRKAVLHREQRKIEVALAEFSKLGKSELEPIAMIEAAQCQLELGNATEAWRTIQPYVQKRPNELTALYQQVDHFTEEDRVAIVSGQILESMQKFDDAIEFLERALDFDHRSSEARSLLIGCLTRLNRDDEVEKQTSLQRELIKLRLECQNLSNRIPERRDDLELRIEYAERLFRCKSLGESQLEAESIVRANSMNRRAHQLLVSIYAERARTNVDWRSLSIQHQAIVDRLEEDKTVEANSRE